MKLWWQVITVYNEFVSDNHKEDQIKGLTKAETLTFILRFILEILLKQI